MESLWGPSGNAGCLQLLLVEFVIGTGGRHGGGFVDHQRAGGLPELIVGSLHASNYIGLLLDHVLCLARIVVHVV